MNIPKCPRLAIFAWVVLSLMLVFSLTSRRRPAHHDDDDASEHNFQEAGNSSNMTFQLRKQGVVSKHSRTFHRYQAVWTTHNVTRNVTVEEWVQSMLTCNETLHAFLDVLRQTPFDGFFFETRPVNATTVKTKPFEFVLVDAPDLYQFATGKASPRKFAEPLANCTAHDLDTACVFVSLHADTTLVSPQPPTDTALLPHYSNLASFCRLQAPRRVVHTVWQLALQTYLLAVTKTNHHNNIWLSTAGMGVPWLHLRIAQRPRYYTYASFRDET